MHWDLSVSYKYNIDGSKILLNQKAYLEKVARAHDLDPNATTGPKTPMDSCFTVHPDDVPNDEDVDVELCTKTKRLI